jgi:hypothetical protein
MFTSWDFAKRRDVPEKEDPIESVVHFKDKRSSSMAAWAAKITAIRPGLGALLR